MFCQNFSFASYENSVSVERLYNCFQNSKHGRLAWMEFKSEMSRSENLKFKRRKKKPRKGSERLRRLRCASSCDLPPVLLLFWLSALFIGSRVFSTIRRCPPVCVCWNSRETLEVSPFGQQLGNFSPRKIANSFSCSRSFYLSTSFFRSLTYFLLQRFFLVSVRCSLTFFFVDCSSTFHCYRPVDLLSLMSQLQFIVAGRKEKKENVSFNN